MNACNCRMCRRTTDRQLLKVAATLFAFVAAVMLLVLSGCDHGQGDAVARGLLLADAWRVLIGIIAVVAFVVASIAVIVIQDWFKSRRRRRSQ